MKGIFAVIAVLSIAIGGNALPPKSSQERSYPLYKQEPVAAPSTLQATFARLPRQSRGGGLFGGQGGGLNTECRRQEVGPGQFKFVCDGVNKDQITLKSEHILWLTSDGNGPQIVDIEVPNYKINELIKAGYKTTPGGSTQINVLLKKPEQSADAEVDVPKSSISQPSVNLQYEPPTNQQIHFPTDKAYRPLSGPILPPLAGSRGRREIDFAVNQPVNYWYPYQGA